MFQHLNCLYDHDYLSSVKVKFHFCFGIFYPKTKILILIKLVLCLSKFLFFKSFTLYLDSKYIVFSHGHVRFMIWPGNDCLDGNLLNFSLNGQTSHDK